MKTTKKFYSLLKKYFPKQVTMTETAVKVNLPLFFDSKDYSLMVVKHKIVKGKSQLSFSFKYKKKNVSQVVTVSDVKDFFSGGLARDFYGYHA